MVLHHNIVCLVLFFYFIFLEAILRKASFLMFVSVILFPPSVSHNCAHPFHRLCHTSTIIRSLFVIATLLNQHPEATSRANSMLFFTSRVAGSPHRPPVAARLNTRQRSAGVCVGGGPWCSCWSLYGVVTEVLFIFSLPSSICEYQHLSLYLPSNDLTGVFFVVVF